MTNCERCSTEIEDDEVQQCDGCKLDGICDDCLMDHECEGTRGSDEE